MKGFSILEFLVALSFFFLILLSGYNALESEGSILREMLARTITEQESNYRLLVLQSVIQKSSEKFHSDPWLAEAVYFFEDLNFGKEKKEDCFSFAIPFGDVVPFQWDGSQIFVPAVAKISGKRSLLLAGVGMNGSFVWNYGKVLAISSAGGLQQVKVDFLLKKDPIQYGTAMEVEVNGIAFRPDGLYWISPAGQYEPFFEQAGEFQYQWKQPFLKVFWRAGTNDAFVTLLP
jgi:hypothetical protein